MPTDDLSGTALGAALLRARESVRPERERLFEDPFAYDLLPLLYDSPLYRAFYHLMDLPVIGSTMEASLDRQIPGVVGGILGRTCFIDEVLREALAEGFEQVVILGAGLDSRPYRIAGVDKSHVFELDQPATQQYKRTRLQNALDVLPSHVTFVPIDFEHQELANTLTTAGFREDVKTVFIWEGVTQYLTAEAVDATLRSVSDIAADGSRLVFTFVHGGVLDGSVQLGGADMLERFSERGEPWVFGLHPARVESYLTARHFRQVERADHETYLERYFKPVGRQPKIMEIEFTVLAEVDAS